MSQYDSSFLKNGQRHIGQLCKTFHIIISMGCGAINLEETSLDSKKPNVSHLNISSDAEGFCVKSKKGKHKITVQALDDFLTHHLENQSNLSPYASSNKIRARQIIEHYIFSDLFRTQIRKNASPSKLTVFALKAWFQRTFQQIMERVHKKYFADEITQEQARHQICEQYVFEVYQMGQFINAGFNKFSLASKHLQIPLSVILLSSDSALYPILNKLKSNYPLVTQDTSLKFPDVAEVQQKINLLELFSSKCFSDPDFINIQTLMDDLRFLLDQADKNFSYFKKDMEELLGEGTLVNCKVKIKRTGENCQYDASSVRRVLIKWAETIIQRIPQVYNSAQFVQFIRSKKKMANQFIFKGIVNPTTHQQVIEVLTELLQSIKYKFDSKVPREQFGLFIYDLLRCKTTRKTGQQIVKLLEKIQNTTTTKSGKLIKCFRVKNRFKKNTRDLLINFRYGDYLVGQAQLCLDVSHEDPKLAKQNKFGHYLYELQRGLFGPTFEMIMKYQDMTRKDLSVTLQADGQISPRTLKGNRLNVKKAVRLCPQNHEMISMTGNLYVQDSFIKSIQLQKKEQDSGICDFCHQTFSYQGQFHYCYYCSIFFCLKCINLYKTVDRTKIQSTCLDRSYFKQIKTIPELKQICQQKAAAMIIFYREQTITSLMFLDQIAFYLASVNYRQKSPFQVYLANVDNKQSEELVQEFKILRTPTTMILDSKISPQITLVGSTFCDIQSLIQIKTRITNGLSKGLKIKCIKCNQEMIENADYRGYQFCQLKISKCHKDKLCFLRVFQSNLIAFGINEIYCETCQICMNTNKMYDLHDAMRLLSVSTKDFTCSNGHIKCSYCSYLCSNNPSYYRDFTGRTYLSTKMTNRFVFCSHFHLMQQTTISQATDYQCYKCKKIIKGELSSSLKFCSFCKQYACKDCCGTQTQNYIEKKQREMLKQVQIVNHFVENKLEQGYPCGCGKYLMKAYQSHQLHQPNIKQFSVLELLGFRSSGWSCRVCNKKETQLKLHLACFYCSYYQLLHGKPGHIQICMQCAINSGLTSRQPHKKIKRGKTNQKCSRGHQTIITSIRTEKELKFDCTSCRKWFYLSTERYECQPCNMKMCLACGKNQLKDQLIWTTLKKCDKSHPLDVSKVPPKLNFCMKCRQYLNGLHFKCNMKNCDYFLCLNCSKE